MIDSLYGILLGAFLTVIAVLVVNDVTSRVAKHQCEMQSGHECVQTPVWMPK